MSRILFSEKEQEIRKMKRCGPAEMIRNSAHVPMPDEEPEFNRPITEKENFKLLFSGRRESAQNPRSVIVGLAPCAVLYS